MQGIPMGNIMKSTFCNEALGYDTCNADCSDATVMLPGNINYK